MPRFHFLRSTAVGLSLGMAAACMSLPAFATTPDTVTFAANSVWAQEIGNLDHSDSSHDYTVAIAAGKTLQLNLLSNNANVYFKVNDQTHDKQLLDSHKTGASTWSSPNATATTYAIQVYMDPDAVKRGETAKYALQVGQYGAADLQPPTTAMTFQANQPWSVENGSLASGAAAHDYTVSIAAGMAVKVNLVASNPQLHFKVDDQTHDKKLVDTSTTGANTWSESAATATAYMIQVYADPAAIPTGQQARFTLQVAQYGSGGAQPTQPAGATTAASPAAATSASTPPASP
ncbi:hypothetical protein ABQJ54_14775 [Rhodanobacter sp. Si-c]|uniref:Uncharacterized protein n=1 Tax=Rhodanobacter lycopersici TaxID=3162487 RepID=A0ABV3QHK5_9GAMM